MFTPRKPVESTKNSKPNNDNNLQPVVVTDRINPATNIFERDVSLEAVTIHSWHEKNKKPTAITLPLVDIKDLFVMKNQK
jgi:hypothetical protein